MAGSVTRGQNPPAEGSISGSSTFANGTEIPFVLLADENNPDRKISPLGTDSSVATNADTAIGGTAPPSKGLLGLGKTNDTPAQYQPLPEGPGGRSIIVEGLSGGVQVNTRTLTVADTVTAYGQTTYLDGTDPSGTTSSATLPIGTYAGTNPSGIRGWLSTLAGLFQQAGGANVTIAAPLGTLGGVAVSGVGQDAVGTGSNGWIPGVQPNGTNAGTGMRGWLSALVGLFQNGQATVLTKGAGAAHANFRNLSSTVQSVKSSPGTLYSLQVINVISPGAPTYIQVFDATPANVTLGTTVPALEFLCGQSSPIYPALPATGITFGTAISIAATHDEMGSTGSANGVIVYAQYL